MRQARSDISAIGGDQVGQEDAEQYALDQMMISCHRLVKDHPEWNALDEVFTKWPTDTSQVRKSRSEPSWPSASFSHLASHYKKGRSRWKTVNRSALLI